MNRATRIIVAVISVLLGIAGINHGFFEVLQGNTPTDGLLIQAIGEAHQMWYYGSEEAITIVPNFLVTGVLAMMVGLAIIVWSVRFVHLQKGPLVLGILFIALFLVGGGIAAQVVFAPFVWAAATRINKPLTWWRKVLPESVRRVLANLWPYSLSIVCLSFVIGLFIAITGFVPGVSKSNPERILAICWFFIFGSGWGLMLLTFVAGFAHDIQERNGNEDTV
jgi:hypothetical protein